MNRTKYAIIGSGPAAFYAANAIRQRDPEGKLVMIGAEGYLPYFRPLISYYLAGLVSLEKLFIKEDDFYGQRKIEFIGGTVTGVEGLEKNLTYQPLAGGEPEKTNGDPSKDHNTLHLRFEKLLIASGSIPTRPDIPGISIPGVYFLRTIKDAKNIFERAKNSKKALLIGGGLVNLKAAYALHTLGLETTLVIASSRVLSQMLDKKGAGIVAAHLLEKGLKMILQNDVVAIHGDGSGVAGVTLSDGQELETDLILVGKGVKPFTPFLSGSGFGGKDGVMVNEELQTNLSGIYAAGDAALCHDMLLAVPATYALWPNATAQGEIAGANMGGGRLTYRGTMRMNATEFFGLPVIAAGEGKVEGGPDEPWESYELEHSLRPKQEPRYLRLVFQKERLVGYVSIGENRRAGMLTNLIRGQTPLAPQQKERLIGGDLVFPLSI